jgi:hypothetical protein
MKSASRPSRLSQFRPVDESHRSKLVPELVQWRRVRQPQRMALAFQRAGRGSNRLGRLSGAFQDLLLQALALVNARDQVPLCIPMALLHDAQFGSQFIN